MLVMKRRTYGDVSILAAVHNQKAAPPMRHFLHRLLGIQAAPVVRTDVVQDSEVARNTATLVQLAERSLQLEEEKLREMRTLTLEATGLRQELRDISERIAGDNRPLFGSPHR